MGTICNCPAAAAIPDIPQEKCPVAFGQIQKVIFQRLYNDDGTPNGFKGTTTSIKTKAAWTPLLSATDSTKVVISPYIGAPTDEPGAVRTFGSGNEVPGGNAIVLGREPTAFTGAIYRASQQTVIVPLKALECESEADNLGAYLVDENGQIECLDYGTSSAPDYRPIPVKSFFVGDKAHGGLEGVDTNAISWSYPPNWSDKLEIVVPTDFNPLTDLIPAV